MIPNGSENEKELDKDRYIGNMYLPKLKCIGLNPSASINWFVEFTVRGSSVPFENKKRTLID